MAASSSATTSTDTPRIAVPAEYFVYVGEADKDGNSKRQAQQSEQNQSPDDPRQGVDKFVRDGAAGLDSLKEYPYIRPASDSSFIFSLTWPKISLVFSLSLTF